MGRQPSVSNSLRYRSLRLMEFKSFLRARADLLDTTGQADRSLQHSTSRRTMVTTSNSNLKVKPTRNPNQCPLCSQSHYINQCPKFLAQTPQTRIHTTTKLRLCLNCLASNHLLPNCRATVCRVCKGKHHTLLHVYKNTSQGPAYNQTSTLYNPTSETTSIQTNSLPTQSDTKQQNNINSNHTPIQIHTNNQVVNSTLTTQSIENTDNGAGACMITQPPSAVLLSTAQVCILDSNKQPHILRALLDSGSQSNFITETAFNKLKLTKTEFNMEVTGFNNAKSHITHRCQLTLRSKTDDTFSIDLSCFIVPNICSLTIQIPKDSFHIPARIKLADEHFYSGGNIDIILGAEQFYSLLCIGQHRLGDGLPILQRTRLGWVVSGPVDSLANKIQCNISLSNQIKKFWEIENCSDCTELHTLPDDEKTCEEIFINTHKRTSDGNFVVELPLMYPPNTLGNSRNTAYRRFKALELKFQRDPKFKQKYVDFMREFEQTGHMIKLQNTHDGPLIFLPHHAVTRDSPTTPIRVVFDASCPTDTGTSLNDIQYKGSIEQDELFNILLRFRKHKYVISADISRMYRCIYLSPNQTYLQSILWRENPTDPIQIYTLTTLSFGLKSAPHLATRCLTQLVRENLVSFPAAAAAIANEFWIDDWISSMETEEQVVETAQQVDAILRGAGFKLQKWKSNSTSILNQVSDNNQTNTTTQFGDKTHKVLGLAWSPDTDNLKYIFNPAPIQKPITKRKILSLISGIFDPLGLLGPILVTGKIFIQQLWKDKTNWDDPVPPPLIKEWEHFYNSLFSINKMNIPRQVICSQYTNRTLRGKTHKYL
ncbi:uncharacterized protein LOC126381471 [Pectinophora gossypiella]|uniref:uncharacterized protein LOC126381471 n=1 Tax=Pectinophora gossypiella TaxID=13191 RepID=UPI00214F01FE|nr:uncharacterized protein LOC126381471 [Pectinophora gossypiella]